MGQPMHSVDSKTANQLLDEVVDQITEKLRAGVPFDLDECVQRYPELEDRLRSLLPGIQMLAELGRASAEAPAPKGPGTSTTETPIRGRLGDYRIVREIGRGGMGVVYEAEQVSLGRKVALKVLPFAAMMDHRQLQRFQNEARAAASLKHPNIVQVHFVGCDRAVHFYAMDHIEGQTLADLIRHLRRMEGLEAAVPQDAGADHSGLAESLAAGRFASPGASSDPDAPTAAYTHDRTPGLAANTSPTPQAAIPTERSTKSPAYFRSIAEIGVQVAEALDHAHQHGVIHRDVKPSNVILDNRGKPWVTDFGLARIETDATLTVSGDLLGTIRYMSPEQALAKRIVVDHRTDVYSLGVTLYELLTLQPAFSGQDREELLRQIAFEEPKPPRKLNKAVPEELEIIVTKAMAKNQTERYDTAQELADDLKRYLEDRPIRARRPTLVQRAAKWSRRHKPIVWSAAVSTFLLLVLGLGGLGVGNRMIAKERDEKDQALDEKVGALAAKTAALKEKDGALVQAKANLTQAEAERQRAESNLTLALDALNTVYLRAIGQDRLLGDREREEGPREFSAAEKTLMEAGLGFYSQIATQNQEQPAAQHQSAAAYLQVAMLQANLDAGEAADATFTEAISRLKKLTQTSPNNAEYHRQLGTAYLAKGNLSRWWPKAQDTFAEAAAAFSKAIELDPSNPDLYALRGQAHERTSQNKKAAEDFERAVELDPNNAKRHHVFAGSLYNNRSPTTPDRYRYLRHAKRAAELAPQDARYHVTLGRYIWQASRDREQALKEFDKAIALNPNLASAYGGRAELYERSGDLQQALRDAEKAIQLDPNGWGPHCCRAGVLRALGRDEEALTEYNRAEQLNPNVVSLWWARGDLHAEREDYAAALRDYDKGVDLNPEYWLSYKRRAPTHYQLGHYREALRDLEKALELRPIDTSALVSIAPFLVAKCPDPTFRDGLLQLAARAVEKSPDRPRAFQERAELYLGLGEWKEGQADLEQAIALDTANHGPHYWLALVSLSLGDSPKYREACAAMMAKFGRTDMPMAANLTAWTCALAPDAVADYAPVLACAARAVEAQPNTDQFIKSLGAVLCRAGRFEEAIEWLTETDAPLESAEADSTSSLAYSWYFLAMAHKKAGNDEKAQEYLNKAKQETDRALADEKHPPPWNRRATLEVLRKEAEALVALPAAPSAPSDEKEPSNDARLSLSGSYQWILHSRRARRLAAEGNWPAAAGAYSEAIKLRPDDPQLWKALGEAQEKLGRWDEALAAYEKAIERKPDELSVWKTRAEGFAQSADWEKAVALYSSLIKHDAADSRLWQARAAAHAALKQWDTAIADWSEAIRLDRESPNFWLLRAEAYLALERYDEALADCDRYVELRPDDAVAAFIRAEMLVAAKQTDEYRRFCREILERFGKTKEAQALSHVARACVLAPKAVSDPKLPVELADRAVARDSKLWTVYTLGMAHFRAGQLDQAAQRFHESLAAGPNWHARSLNWLGLALVHRERGEMEQSRQWLAKAVELMVRRPAIALQDRLEAQLLRREVEELLGDPSAGKENTEKKSDAPEDR